MVKEIIDELDEQGNLIGTVEKDIAHRDGLWHRSVHVWVINDKNEILLQKRCAKKKFFPNVWDVSFAGHVDAYESTLDSAIREGKEEIGIDIDLSKIKYLATIKEKLVWKDIISNEFVDVYLLRQDIKISDIILQDIEVESVKYVSLREFFSMIDNKDKSLFSHKEEYQMLKKVLK